VTAEVDQPALPASFELRPESPADAPFLFTLYCDVRSEELAQTGWPPEQVEAFLRSQFELQTRAYRATFPDAEFNLILCGGRPAGRIYVARLAGEIRLVDLALAAEFRNRGIGTVLLRGLVASADQAGLPVRFHVERSNRARHLYERFGFQIVSENGPYFLLERPPGGSRPS
jgi:ribosomal protein S18 acetylase RimI-like enzyme